MSIFVLNSLCSVPQIIDVCRKPREPRQKGNEVKKDYKKYHFECTTAEPHIVCCIEGAKVALGMHKAGNKRFGSGWWDDLRSFSDDNTRLIGDFTKSLRVISILEHCAKKLNDSAEWRGQLTTALERSSSNMSFTALRQAVGGEKGLCSMGFKRQRLQIRMFELGETYYIGESFHVDRVVYQLMLSNTFSQVWSFLANMILGRQQSLGMRCKSKSSWTDYGSRQQQMYSPSVTFSILGVK